MTEPVFQNAKTYHVQHQDGRTSAWVGSHNFTLGGFSSNMEAATVLNSDDDDPTVIDQVCVATVAASTQTAAFALTQAILQQLERRLQDARLRPAGSAPARPSPLLVDHCHMLLDRLDRATASIRRSIPCCAAGAAHRIRRPGCRISRWSAARHGDGRRIWPGAGRSTFALNLLTHAAVVQRAAAGLYSFKYSDDEAVLRVISATTRIRHTDLRSAKVGDAEWSTLADTMSGLADAPLYLDCRQPPHLDSLCSAITATVAREGLDLVAVDPPSQVIAHPSQDSPGSQLHEVLRRLKHLAMQLRIHIITTAELERPPRPMTPTSGPANTAAGVRDHKNRNAVMEGSPTSSSSLHRPTPTSATTPAWARPTYRGQEPLRRAPKVTIAHQLHYARFATATATPPAPTTT